MPASTVRIWDLPTRLFHWSLAAAIVGLVATAKTGAMVWHFRLGYCVLALLAFRLIWGLVGGHWSRFVQFPPSPARAWRYLTGRAGDTAALPGHNALGALSVYAMLLVFVAQVATGLVSDDAISFSGPLARFVPGMVVDEGTSYHRSWGQWLVIGLSALHVAAVLFYVLVRKRRIVGPMVHGDAVVPTAAGVAAPTASRDDGRSRMVALLVLLLCAAATAALVQLGG